ncbi:hypothetical protein O181_013169 [Austropuccinia psidii MF-1]|uniref:Uncharacterized protein n=1 Tax=Austropuccinia psidii MF-1 TaxID=1389203 RepID=A0A9Q3GNK5_9BASI|nr:hypothetical protein [Austropuccinia psidii MF-1]
MKDCKSVSTPLVPNKHLGPATEDKRNAFYSVQPLQISGRARYTALEGIPSCAEIPTRDTGGRPMLLMRWKARTDCI